jgi:hemolysin activation/secretion protein
MPFTGPEKTFSDIERALEAIRTAYTEAGVTAMQVWIPEQTLKSGVVTLQVDELKLDKVEISGARHRSRANIRRAVPPVEEGTVPNDLRISEALRLANENPGRQMGVTFRSEDDGKLQGVLRVADREPVAGQVTMDNTGSRSTGKYRLGVAAQHHNLFDRDVVGTLQLQSSPGYWSEVQVLAANARIPIYSLGLMIDAGLARSSVDSGAIQNPSGGPTLYLDSKGSTRYVRVTRFLPRLGGWDQRYSVGWDHRSVQSGVAVTPGGQSFIPDIVLRPLSLTYSGQWRDDELSVFALAGHHRNIPGDGRSAKSVFAEPGLRPLSNPSYRINRLNVNVSLPLWGGQANAAFAGQWSPDALVAAEQFGLGGDGSIRGFNGRVASSDQGERIGVEWLSALGSGLFASSRNAGGVARLNASDQTQPSMSSHMTWGWQAFVEAGQLRRNQSQAGEISKVRLAGAGLGVRLVYQDHLTVRADLGVVLRGDNFAERGDRYVHMAASYGF